MYTFGRGPLEQIRYMEENNRIKQQRNTLLSVSGSKFEFFHNIWQTLKQELSDWSTEIARDNIRILNEWLKLGMF